MNSFGNGIFLDSNVPMLDGTWYNPQTGDHFTVRDCFIEDNNIEVMTTDGRMLNYDIIQKYVKSDKPIPKIEQPKPQKTQSKSTQNKSTQSKSNITSGLAKSPVVDDIDALLTPEDAALLGTPIESLETPAPTNTSSKLTSCNSRPFKPEIKNADIIAKGLKKAEIPKINVALKWENFPKKELDALVTIMDIPEEDIVEWMVSEYFQFDDLKIAIKNFLNDVMKNGYCVKASKQKTEVDECEKPVEAKKSATTKKSSKSKK